jgi:hypothetical protein
LTEERVKGFIALLERKKRVKPVKEVGIDKDAKNGLSDYDYSLVQVSNMPRFFIGQEVKTKHGIGIIVAIEMPHNGLYLQPECAEAVVWYSTQRAFEQQIRWVSFTYKLSDLSPIENKE